jgi:uncharacterized protein (DUF4415 family)
VARKLTLEEEVDNPPLSDEQLAAMRPAREVMPPEFFEAVKRKQGQRGPGKKPAKVPVTIRLDPDILAALRATGAGWQSRASAALRKLVKPRRPNPVGQRLRRRAARKKRSSG